MANALSAAVFVDRDGTIMEDVITVPTRKRKVFPGVREALRRLKSNGFKLIVITNQSGIGRGLFTVDEYRAVESEVIATTRHGLIDATYFCPDVPGQHSKSSQTSSGNDLAGQARSRNRSFPFVFYW